ncbi:hypothetical protein OXPF_03240 [Oxobacter pfennigii]|uniref:Uncharacterized protein n=1 Tax=Oxobacter pfennigii TaxID=36849 RepID=A0A0N8NTV1_9CLOT|nr:hypothetical protein OXPF_03240 [Oxobacter pfennigii]
MPISVTIIQKDCMRNMDLRNMPYLTKNLFDYFTLLYNYEHPLYAY